MKKHYSQMNRDQSKDVLSRYLNGSCTDAERALVEQWYNSRASEEDANDIARIDLETLKEQIWNSIQQSNKRSGTNYYRLTGIAAAMLLIMSLILMLFRSQLFSPQQKVAWHEVIAPKAKVIKVHLPDGSNVWLNAGSTLAYADDFGEKLRTVKLSDGEAYFDVAHNTQKPFIVITGKLKTQVLGTSFNIRAGSETQKVTVTVLGGKVAVTKKGAPPLFLLPDEQAEFNKKTGALARFNVTSKNTIGWIEGKFRFHNEELEAITSELQRRFNVSFSFKSENLRTLRFNTGFNATDRLQDILNDLTKTGNIAYSIHKNRVTISLASNHP